MTWRGREEIKGGAEFKRHCPTHNKPLNEGTGDTLLCPIGHVVPSDNFVVVRVTPASARPAAAAQAAAAAITPAIGVGDMAKGQKGTGTSRIVDSIGFHTLGGHRMFLYLEQGKRTPFQVRVKMVDEQGKATSGILETAASDAAARPLYEKRVKQASDRGWRVGNLRKSTGLTDIPDATKFSTTTTQKAGRR
jgi:hypothetical protein